MAYRLLNNKTDSNDESTLGYIGRTGARTLARGAESILGLPGDILKGAEGLNNYLANKLTGEETHIPLVNPNISKLANAGIEKLTGKSDVISKNILPTSENIHGVTKQLTGEHLEPKTSGEEFYDQIIGDAAALFSPVKGKVPFAKAIGGALGRSAIGNTAQWATEKVTGSPLVGTGAKIGAMALAGTIGGRKQLNNLKNESYKDAFSKIPEKTKFDFKPEKQKLQKLADKFLKGDHPDKKFIVERLNSIDSVVGGGKGAIEDVIDLKQDWNKYLSDPKLSKSNRSAIKQAVGIVNDGIKRYGSTNPEFFKPYQIAEELTGALQSTNYVQKVLSSYPYLQDSVKNPIINKLLWVGAISSATQATIPSLVGAGVSTLGIRESAKAYQLLSKSPLARKYYKDIIQSTLKNDIKAVARTLPKLDKLADKFEFKNTSPEESPERSKSRYRLVS